MLESTLAQYEFEEPQLFYLCAQANARLGYLVIAEQLFLRCAAFPSHQARCLTELAALAIMQDNKAQAIEHLTNSLALQPDYKVAYQLGCLWLVDYQSPKQAIQYLQQAVELASEDCLRVEPQALANCFVARMKCYEGLGMHEHARSDY